MGQVIGRLREGEATWGEKEVLKLLEKNTPKEFTIYVECPIQVKRKDSHPDFIILTNYGFIVLEVKDWAIIRVDKYTAFLSSGKKFPNPVETARDYALDITNAIHMREQAQDHKHSANISYGHAVVLAHIGPAIKSQVQLAWGENFVFNLADLQPGIINKRLHETIRGDKISPLSQIEMNMVRGVLNPEIVIQDVTLDEEQEKLVMEDALPKEAAIKPSSSIAGPSLFAAEFGFSELSQGELEEANFPEENKKILENSSVRLVRGEMGSGKTLVLKAKARRLSKEHPDWKILVLSLNKNLAKDIARVLKSCKNIEVSHIHSLISSYIQKNNSYEWRKIIEQENWVRNKENSFPIIKELGVDFVAGELKWIQEVMIASREQYLQIRRVGRGDKGQLSSKQRDQVYDVLEALNHFLDQQRQFSWETLVVYFLDKLRKAEIVPPQYDAIFIDEAQDFAPSWIAIVNHLLKTNGQLFLADDPKQSIFRFFSWRQKGVDVVGRTRRLMIPYRNTRQIFMLADSIIKGDQTVIARLKSDGEYSEPDLDNQIIRSGEKPLLIRARNQEQEIHKIEEYINYFRLTLNIPKEKIAVIHPGSRQLNEYQKYLKKHNISFYTCNPAKGLEFEVVFFCGLDLFFPDHIRDNPETISHQKRLVYTNIGRCRQYLYLFHVGDLAKEFDVINDFVYKQVIN